MRKYTNRLHHFFYKHNNYKHIEAEISEKSKHIVSIFWDWEKYDILNITVFIGQASYMCQNKQIKYSSMYDNVKNILKVFYIIIIIT